MPSATGTITLETAAGPQTPGNVQCTTHQTIHLLGDCLQAAETQTTLSGGSRA